MTTFNFSIYNASSYEINKKQTDFHHKFLDILQRLYQYCIFLFIIIKQLIIKSGLYTNTHESLTISAIFTRYIADHYQHHWFKTINSPISKYIIVKLATKQRTCLNFASYDYLGLTNVNTNIDTMMHQYSTYQCRSNPEMIESVEQELAQAFGKQYCVVANSGYTANYLFLKTLTLQYDLVISDKENHTSIRHGCSFAKHKIVIDRQKLEATLIKNSGKHILVVLEGIYSMTGQILDLSTILALKHQYKFHLYVDEAHSIGAIGPSISHYFSQSHAFNTDFANESIDYTFGTFSKAFNSHGGFILLNDKAQYHRLQAAKQALIDSNEYVDLPVISCQRILDNLPTVMLDASYTQLKQNTRYLMKQLCIHGFNVVNSPDSPVVCIQDYPYRLFPLVKHALDNGVALVVSGYPSTPHFHLCIIRICCSAHHTLSDIDYLMDVLCYKTPSQNHPPIPVHKLVNTSIETSLQNFAPSGPCGFYGKIPQYDMLVNRLSGLFNKQATIFVSDAYLGIIDMIDYCKKRALKYHMIDLSQLCSYKTEHDCVIGRFDIHGGFGCFMSFDSTSPFHDKLSLRTHVFSANSPAYIFHHNLSLIDSFA